MKYEYKAIKIYTSKVEDNIEELNARLKLDDGWEIFKILYVPRYREDSSSDFILHYCRRKLKESKS